VLIKLNWSEGKGTQRWKKTGLIYDGDWKDDLRHGYGTMAKPAAASYGYKKLYAGGWKKDKRHGYGTNYYSEEEYYEGEWYEDKRSGWGRMYYKDKSIYEGEWLNDMRNGQGMLRLASDNRYEGTWKDNKKHGSGRFFYLDKGQLLKGTWVEDICKCGTMEDFGRDGAPSPTVYPIPQCKLAYPQQVIEEGAEQALSQES
jgi:hypothetical protein